jgi:Ca-activated chloride channel homolog
VSFASPHWLWGLALVALIPLAESWLTAGDRDRLARLVARPLWPRVVHRPREAWRHLRVAFWAVTAAGIVVALARPQWGIVREKVEREGADVVIVLDSSASMSTEDVAPSRFFLARAALLSLVSRLEGDRLALVAFEAEAYPLVPLTLDADAVGLFLDTLEPGVVPSPGSSLGVGLARGLAMFVDKERRNKVLVLVSDGEDLEGEIDAAVRGAREAGVVVHAVGVGTEKGAPVPQVDREGNRAGFKKDEGGSAVISRLHPETLEMIAKATGGRFFLLTPTDTSLAGLAQAIAGLEQKALAREFAYRKKERFQVPLAIATAAAMLAVALPVPRFRWRRVARSTGRVVALALLALGGPDAARAEGSGQVVGEILLTPKRLTAEGRQHYSQGNHPAALKSFEQAAATRPKDRAARLNLADALYKNGKYDEAAAVFKALGEDPKASLAAEARFNLGNTLYQKHDYPGAIRSYRDALAVAPSDTEAIRNLELALRALQKQKQRQDQESKKDQENQSQKDQNKQQQAGKDPGSQKKQTAEQRERERFEKEAGMPKERAMQLLDALQQNEKGEQKKLLAARRRERRGGKDW